MTLVFAPVGRRLTDEHNIPVTCLALKRGDVMPVSIRVEGASPTASVGLYAKPANDYSILPMIAVVASGNPVSLTPQTNTERINTALGIGTDHELSHLDMMCEIVYSEAGKQVATATLNLILHNNVARPGLPDAPLQDDPYSVAVPIATTTTAGIVMPDNTSITITPQGKISASAQSTPIATTTTAGKVKPDGDTIKVGADGNIETNSIRSIAGYERCKVELGTGLSASVVGAELIRLDVAAGSDAPGVQGYFVRKSDNVFESDVSLQEGIYLIDLCMINDVNNRSVELLYNETLISDNFIAGAWNSIKGNSGNIANNAWWITTRYEGGNSIVYIRACIHACESASGKIAVRTTKNSSSCLIQGLRGTYKRLGGMI